MNFVWIYIIKLDSSFILVNVFLQVISDWSSFKRQHKLNIYMHKYHRFFHVHLILLLIKYPDFY